MNYLALCQRVREEAGITGSGPTTVLNQSGQLLKLVNWVSQAWVEIQLMRPNWLFMHESGGFFLDAGTKLYDPADKGITDVKLWDTGSLLYSELPLASGNAYSHILEYVPFARYSRLHMVERFNTPDDDRPVHFTIKPDNQIELYPAPAAVTGHSMFLNFDYKRSTQQFAADADVPTNLPDDFHMMIVWQALKYYGFYENAPEVLDEAETNFDNLLLRLENEQLPEMSEDFEALA